MLCAAWLSGDYLHTRSALKCCVLHGYFGTWYVLHGYLGIWYAQHGYLGIWYVLHGYLGTWYVLHGYLGTWYVLHGYLGTRFVLHGYLGTRFVLHGYGSQSSAMTSSLHKSIHPPELGINPSKAAGGCPCGGVIKK